ncbi:Intracellular sulfur oxidation protein, DsrE/DsrF family [Algoriphagus locisalis]|uniref:Intracellular sulfur oxidation protein, DsrE/DsrF family n=1 Tax=Algoriphagus locisalis TaxID=305507 RepID=A0A1I7DY09_9BACT|nr:DsrE family protein [Algoriphagus locisalis]SFU16506.1 Intracellular sulfur oxidation protein, DsrE/DsrF family [Algoriphagus locisalis]
MIRLFASAIFCFAFFATQFSNAQDAQFPLVKGFGGIYEVSDATERPDGSLDYYVLVDLSTGAENNDQISRWVDNVARMMNLHGLAGVSKDRMHVKVVVHGGAIATVMSNEAYQKRYNTDNPNIPVYKALEAAGAEILVCGQSMRARNLQKSDLYDGINVALSALTTVTTYAPKGYTVLKF